MSSMSYAKSRRLLRVGLIYAGLIGVRFALFAYRHTKPIVSMTLLAVKRAALMLIMIGHTVRHSAFSALRHIAVSIKARSSRSMRKHFHHVSRSNLSGTRLQFLATLMSMAYHAVSRLRVQLKILSLKFCLHAIRAILSLYRLVKRRPTHRVLSQVNAFADAVHETLLALAPHRQRKIAIQYLSIFVSGGIALNVFSTAVWADDPMIYLGGLINSTYSLPLSTNDQQTEIASLPNLNGLTFSPGLSGLHSFSPGLFGLHYSGGNDSTRFEVSPNYSRESGFTIRGAVGHYVYDNLALGLIGEYGRYKQEYILNGGLSFNDNLSLIATIGFLQEKNDYVNGREPVDQLEYGLSLRANYGPAFLQNFELNGYGADANGHSEYVETGRLYGVQFTTGFNLGDATFLRLGTGYEWLQWKTTDEIDRGMSFLAEATHRVTDRLGVSATTKIGISEHLYGAGIFYDVDTSNMNRLSLGYNYLDGQHGIADDQRVELRWTVGFGEHSPKTLSSDKLGTNAPLELAKRSTEAQNSRRASKSLLNDVMQRPAYLPARVLARSKSNEVDTCDIIWTNINLNVRQAWSGTYMRSIAITDSVPSSYSVAELQSLAQRTASIDVYMHGQRIQPRPSSSVEAADSSLLIRFSPDLVPNNGGVFGKLRYLLRAANGTPLVCFEETFN